LQPAAEPAAEAALEVRKEKGDDAFWAAHDRFAEHWAELANAKGPDLDRIVALAAEAGGAPDNVRRAIATKAHARAIEADEEVAEDFEVESIPHLFVNGRRIEGTQPRAKLERMIDEEIATAQQLLAKGAAPDAVYETRIANARRPWVPKTRPLVAMPANDPSLGPPKAPVTVHVFADYQCALCVAVERMIADQRKAHGDRVRFVWHDLPLPRHDGARLFARAAREAHAQRGAAAFWKMHDRIAFAPERPDAAALDRFATEAGLDVGKWRRALDGDAHEAELDADAKAAAGEEITETPTFLVVAGKAAEGKVVGHVEYASKLPRAVEMALDEGEDADDRDAD
jgi:protein-disulfide isomerase